MGDICKSTRLWWVTQRYRDAKVTAVKEWICQSEMKRLPTGGVPGRLSRSRFLSSLSSAILLPSKTKLGYIRQDLDKVGYNKRHCLQDYASARPT
jgi:hypothetical protein